MIQVSDLTRAFHAALELMCERSLTDPQGRGVLVIQDGIDWTIELSPEVPWGEVHEYPNGRIMARKP